MKKMNAISDFETSKLIVELRTEKGMNQAELRRAINIPQTTLVNYERGERKVSIEWLAIFADFFNVSIEYLLGLTKIKNGCRFCDDVFVDDNETIKCGELCRKARKLTPNQKNLINNLINEFFENADNT